MATSSPYILTPVVGFVSWLRPASVLDVGCGYGVWGVVLRQHLDYPWDLEAGHVRWRTRIIGIEAWEGYRNPLWEFAYDEVIVAEAVEELARLAPRSFDVALRVEVLEHLDALDGHRSLVELRRVATHVVVTTPDHPLPQEDREGNPFEVHKTFWPWSALRRRGAQARLPASGSHVAVFSSRPGEIGRWLRGRRSRVLGPLVPPRARRGLQRASARLGLHPGPPAQGGGPPVQRVR